MQTRTLAVVSGPGRSLKVRNQRTAELYGGQQFAGVEVQRHRVLEYIGDILGNAGGIIDVKKRARLIPEKDRPDPDMLLYLRERFDDDLVDIMLAADRKFRSYDLLKKPGAARNLVIAVGTAWAEIVQARLYSLPPQEQWQEYRKAREIFEMKHGEVDRAIYRHQELREFGRMVGLTSKMLLASRFPKFAQTDMKEAAREGLIAARECTVYMTMTESACYDTKAYWDAEIDFLKHTKRRWRFSRDPDDDIPDNQIHFLNTGEKLLLPEAFIRR